MPLVIRFSVQYFVLFAVMATMFPYFQVFLRARGFSKPQVGYLLGLTSLASVFGPVLIGYLADRLGRRRGLLIACLVVFAAVLVPLSVTSLFWPAAALVIGVGFTCRTTIPLTDALASSELSDPEHQYGKVRIWGSFGFVLTLLGIRALELVDEKSSASMMTCMLIPTGLCVLSSLLLPDRHRRGKARGAAEDGTGHFGAVFWLFLLAAGLHQFGMSAYYSFFTLFLKEELKMEQAAWVWAVGSAAEIPLLFYAGRVIRRFGLSAMLIASMAAVSVRLGILALVPPLGAILPLQILHALCFGLFHGASIEFVRRKVPGPRRGLAMTLYMSLSLGLPTWLGSSLGGNIVERWGYPALFGAYALVPLVGIVLVAAAGRKLNLPPRAEPPAATGT
ncbi:MAG TPA: MFS transporter [Phycisphaerae bacterium]|nr:MFS transporter [Phycisphaerae bacterium]